MEHDIIPGSSYLVYEGSLTKSSPINCVPGHVNRTSKTVTFYTFDGKPISTIEHHFNFEKMNSKLDPSALVPRPVSYRKIFMPSFRNVDLSIIEAGYMILFHDENGNRILWELLNSRKENVKSWLEYDLTNAFEEEPDFSLKDVEMDIIEESNDFNLNDTQINFSRKTKIDFGLSTINFGMSCMSLSRIDPVEEEEDKKKGEEEPVQDPSTCILF
jgi:hypothetical protein